MDGIHGTGEHSLGVDGVGLGICLRDKPWVCSEADPIRAKVLKTPRVD